MAFVDLIEKNQKPGMVVAEIGTFDGTTTKAYVEIIKKNKGHLYAIDWFEGSESVVGSGIHSHNKDNSDKVYNTFINNVKPYLDVITIMRKKSWDAIIEIPDNSLDICFIDADHRYSSVYKDIELCLPKMKSGGLLCGHDLENINSANKGKSEWLEQDYCELGHYGVIQAVYDHFGFDIITMPDPDGQKLPIWIKKIN